MSSTESGEVSSSVHSEPPAADAYEKCHTVALRCAWERRPDPCWVLDTTGMYAIDLKRIVGAGDSNVVLVEGRYLHSGLRIAVRIGLCSPAFPPAAAALLRRVGVNPHVMPSPVFTTLPNNMSVAMTPLADATLDEIVDWACSRTPPYLSTGLPHHACRVIILDVLLALRACHDAGVGHADVRPQNVWLKHGRAVLAGFRLATRVATGDPGKAEGMIGRRAGTSAEFQAPEARTGKMVSVPRADVWAAGALLVYMLTGGSLRIHPATKRPVLPPALAEPPAVGGASAGTGAGVAAGPGAGTGVEAGPGSRAGGSSPTRDGADVSVAGRGAGGSDGGSAVGSAPASPSGSKVSTGRGTGGDAEPAGASSMKRTATSDDVSPPPAGRRRTATAADAGVSSVGPPAPDTSTSPPSTDMSMARQLLLWMLDPTPSRRPTVQQVLDHQWLRTSPMGARVPPELCTPPVLTVSMDSPTRVLGRGATSTVVAGHDHATPVAFKILPRGADRVREARVLRSMPPNPTVMPAVRVFRHPYDHQAVFAMPRARCDFLTVAKTQKLSVEVACIVLRDLMQAVAHCHAHGVCHLDIKPDNLFLNGAGDRVVLGDFGNAVLVPPGVSHDAAVARLGTDSRQRPFAAPEMYHSGGELLSLPRIDMWSCGAVMLYLMTLETPKRTKRSAEKTESHLQAALDSVPGVTRNKLDQLLKALLDHTPRRRPTAAEVLAHPAVAAVPASARLPQVVIPSRAATAAGVKDASVSMLQQLSPYDVAPAIDFDALTFEPVARSSTLRQPLVSHGVAQHHGSEPMVQPSAEGYSGGLLY